MADVVDFGTLGTSARPSFEPRSKDVSQRVKKIAYLVHDLTDSAVHRRLRMLVAGGAAVTPIGFRRQGPPVREIEGLEAVDLGQTEDGRLLRRLFSVAGASVATRRFAEALAGADVILARNLEMLTIAARARRRHAAPARLVYECLDIHRLLLSHGLEGRLLRRLETRLWRSVDLLLTSSASFVEHYFKPRRFPGEIRLLENKVLVLRDRELPEATTPRAPGPPWRIGWFGMLRCHKSLELLGDLARDAGGVVEIVLRGRPSASVFPDFDAAISRYPHLRFEGPYRSPQDLRALYSDVHFSWTIDYFEEGQNSAWLLPNRVYEGTLYGAVPIYQRGVETSRWLAGHGVGVELDGLVERGVADFFHRLDALTYARLVDKVRTVPRRDLVVDRADCRELVEVLCGR
ncbi:MAG: glycosyl transferase family 1 [Hyphomicrobiales bacterium]|nr:glycosyl transferase family 1 [Hyphomicrobiales bacterium]